MTAFNSIGIVEGPAYMEDSEDGPMETSNYYIGICVGDKEFRNHRPYRHRQDAENFLKVIETVGLVNLAYWTELEPRMSLEEKFSLYAQREVEVRHGFRSEEDIYHGIP